MEVVFFIMGGALFVLFCFVLHYKEELKTKERFFEEDTSKLTDRINYLEERNKELNEQVFLSEKRLEISEMCVLMRCSNENAKMLLKLLDDVSMKYEYNTATSKLEKKKIVSICQEFQKLFTEELQPIIEEKNYDLCISDIDFDGFLDSSYDGIQINDKLRMVSLNKLGSMPTENQRRLIETLDDDN